MATTSALVQQMLGPMYSTRIALTGPIRTAGVIMTQLLACAARKGVTIDSDTRREIETALAAFAYQLIDPGYTSRSTLSASGSFEGKTDMGLRLNKFGQLALLLDPSGCLELINDRKKQGGMVWLGKPSTEAQTYAERNGEE